MVIFTYRFRCRCQYRYAHTRISKWPFPYILSVSYAKEGVTSRDQKFVWFSIFFNAYQAFWRDFHVKGNNKKIRTRYETCLKLKLKKQIHGNIVIRTKQHCQTVFCFLYCYLWKYFLLSSSVFIADFEHLNDGREC